MRLLPESLFGRLITALCAALLVMAAVIVLLVLNDQRDFAVRAGGAEETAERIATIVRRLGALHGEARAIELQRIQQSLRPRDARPPEDGPSPPELTPEPTPGPLPGPPPDRPAREPTNALPAGAAGPGGDVAAIYVKLLRERLDVSYQVRAVRKSRDESAVINLLPQWLQQSIESPAAVGDPGEPGDGPPPMGPEMGPGMGPPMGPPPHPRRAAGDGAPPDIAVTFPDRQVLLFRVPYPKLLRFERDIFWQLGLLVTALAGALYFMTRSITRPLRDLTAATQQIGRSLRAEPLAEAGPREIRDVMRSFNAMQDRLRRYLDSRTRVLAAMSHDLRTPLTRLRLRLELIQDEALRSRFSRDLDEMESMVTQALGLFRGLNDVEPKVALDVNALLAALQSDYRDSGREIGIDGQALRPVMAQPGALRRCLSNLLDNALRFATVVEVHVEDAASLTICVRDNGPGIPEAELEAVFEPFYRVESSRSRDTSGTGLGLAIARDIAQAHHGTLRLRNRPEGGLEAVLTLPRS